MRVRDDRSVGARLHGLNPQDGRVPGRDRLVRRPEFEDACDRRGGVSLSATRGLQGRASGGGPGENDDRQVRCCGLGLVEAQHPHAAPASQRAEQLKSRDQHPIAALRHADLAVTFGADYILDGAVGDLGETRSRRQPSPQRMGVRFTRRQAGDPPRAPERWDVILGRPVGVRQRRRLAQRPSRAPCAHASACPTVFT
jgi:hypothetical protein